MSVTTTVILEGTVSRHVIREYAAKAATATAPARAAGAIRSVLIVGDNTLAQARVPDALELPPIGTFITAEATVSSYRDDDEVALVKYIEPVVAGRK